MKEISNQKGILRIVRSNDNIFIRGKNTVPEFGVIHIDEGYHLFKSSYYIYIYNDEILKIYNSVNNSFSNSYVNTNYILGSTSSDADFILFEKTSNVKRVFHNYEEIAALVFDKNVALYFKNYFLTTSGKTLTKRNKIEMYDINQNLEFVWQFELSQNYWLSQELQIVNDTVFFICRKGGNRAKKVIGLDLETGEIKWELNYERPYNENLIALLLNKEDNLCYGLGREYYQVFNPVTGQIILQKNMQESMSPETDPELSRQAIYDGKLWFVSGRGSKTKFGALDIEKAEIDFIQDYPLEEDEQFDTPVYHNGRLFLRGLHYNVLYIFGKEVV